MQTHYDNLRISREAPPEVIRAAYKALSQKHHPDRNNGSPESHRIMTILNTAYDVLSDPVTRAEHDAWILAQEEAAKEAADNMQRAAAARAADAAARRSRSTSQSPPPRPSPTPEAGQSPNATSSVKTSKEAHFLQSAGPVIFLLFIFALMLYALGNKPRSGPIVPLASEYQPETPAIPYPQQKAPAPLAVQPTVATTKPTATPSRGSAPAPIDTYIPNPAQQTYSRKPTAPNGRTWPTWTGYVPGYPILKTGGLSTLTIDNSRNDEDVFLKLFALSGSDKTAVRYAFIKARTSFKFLDIAPGYFDVRYQNLDTGKISRSEGFALEETEEYNGTRYSQMTLTLYKVLNGNSRTHEITERDF